MFNVMYKDPCTIIPSKPTWTGRLSLTEFDQIGTIAHVPTIYFYTKPSDSFKGNVIETLKSSLSRTLCHFYPIAGRLRWLPGNRFELDCNAAGVKFLEAEIEAELLDFDDFSPRPEFEKLIPQVNYDDPIETIPVVLVQLTMFKCGGFSLGVNNSHVVIDGISGLHFMTEWGRIARGESIETVPVFDWSILGSGESEPEFDHKEFDQPPLLIGEIDNLKEREKETTVAMLKLSKSQIEKLKSKVNKSKYSESTRGFSRYETVTGHVWRSMCKARGNHAQQPTAMSMCIDFRRKIQPPLPRGYFGNAVFDVNAVSTSGELISNELDFAAQKIRETVKKVTNEYVRSGIQYLKNQKDLKRFQELDAFGSKEGPFYGNPNFGLVSWLSLPVYGLDFGWGKEVYMGPGTYDFADGDALILSDQNDDGSMILVTCLQVDHMKAFKKHFLEDI